MSRFPGQGTLRKRAQLLIGLLLPREKKKGGGTARFHLSTKNPSVEQVSQPKKLSKSSKSLRRKSKALMSIFPQPKDKSERSFLEIPVTTQVPHSRGALSKEDKGLNK
jgi:hypothetical protein